MNEQALRRVVEAPPPVVVEDRALPKRDARGRLLPGYSGNPGGRARVPQVLRDAGEEACALLVKIMRKEEADEEVSPGKAAITIIDRLYPKPQPETGGGGAGADAYARFAMLLTGQLPPPVDDDEEDT